MNYSKFITVLTVNALLLFFGSFFSHTQDYKTWVMDNWNKDKEETFKEAKEQDKFVLLFVGRPTCTACQDMSEMLCNPDNPFNQILDDKYVTLYRWFDDEDSRNEVYEYIEEIYEERLAGLNRQLPWLFIINPDKEGESVTSYYRPTPEYRPDEETMRKFLAIDLLDGQDINWYVYRDVIFNLAQEQNKNIFRFLGSGTSPNSQKMMQQLMEDPLKQILKENYILWYEDSDCGCDIFAAAADEPTDEEVNYSYPYISIIDYKYPHILLEELWGVQEEETLEEILKKYSVSNDKILPDNIIVNVLGNVLHISNNSNNEQIRIFTLSGQQIASVRKNDLTVKIDASAFPKGILVVTSSSGWSKKILIR